MADTVRAKFKVTGIQRGQTARWKPGEAEKYRADRNYNPESEMVELQTILLAPVYSRDPDSENSKFWDAAPSGEIKLGTINPAAWEVFELGGEYYIDFIKAS